MPLLLLYFLLVFGVNILHFLLYYYLSGAAINQYNLIFTGLFSVFLLWLITLSAKKIWKFANIILVMIMAIYYTANFLFFQVFHEFFNIWKFSSLMDLKNFNFFSDYLKGAPLTLYAINFGWMILMMLIIISYKPKYLYAEKLPMMNQAVVDGWQSKIKKSHFLFTLLLGLGLFSSNLAYQYYLTQKPADYWWQHSAQQQDFTVWGDLTYKTLFEPLGDFINKTKAQASEPILIINNDSNPQEEIIKTEPETDKLSLIKNNLKQLAKLNQQEIRHSCLNQTRFTNQPNIVFIQLESVPSWAIDQTVSIMPFLKELKKNNFSVDHFFANSCETINAEFSTLCGASVDSTGPIPNQYTQGNYYCLPQILHDQLNYQTNLYHANYADFWSRDKLAPNWGFDNLHFSPEFEVRTSDLKVLDQLATDLKNATTPSFNYFISFTSHGPHSETYLETYNENNLDYPDIPFSTLNDVPINIKNSIDMIDGTTNHYLSLLKAVDQSLEHFFKKLDEYDLRKNTIVVIYGDHRYYRFKPANTLENFYNYNEIPLIMVLPEKSGQGRPSVASHLDIAPSILDLLNRSDLIPENFIGQSLFDANFHNLALNKCLQEFSYIDQNVIIRGNSANQEYYLLQELNKDVDTDAYLKILPELNQTIDAYLPEMLLGK